jgi:hypothetical protein
MRWKAFIRVDPIKSKATKEERIEWHVVNRITKVSYRVQNETPTPMMTLPVP